MFQVEVDFGTGWTDISSGLFGRYPITSYQAIHNETAPTINTCQFSIINDNLLVGQFLAADGDIPVRIHEDSVDYFYGLVRPTQELTVGAARAESFTIECVDSWYRLDRVFTGADFIMRGCAVCEPSNKTLSILHQLFYRAGFYDSELSLSAIATTIAAISIDTSAEQTPKYRDVIERLLLECGYSAYCDAGGVIHLYDLGPATISPSDTFESGDGGNLVDGYKVTRAERQYEGVEVLFYPPVTLSDQTVFYDTTGVTGLYDAQIIIPAGGYYPEGADATHSVDAEYNIDDYDIIDAQTLTLVCEVSVGTVPTATFTPGSKRAALRLYSAGGCTISRLKIVAGTVIAKGDIAKAIREAVANTSKRERIELEYVGDAAGAERLALLRTNWHTNAIRTYELHCSDMGVAPGEYRDLDESEIMGLSTTVRVVSVERDTSPKRVIVIAEGVAALTVEEVTTWARAKSRTISGAHAVDKIDYMGGPLVLSPEGKKSLLQHWSRIYSHTNNPANLDF